MEELRRTMLIQSAKNNIDKKSTQSPLTFGGGLRNGGIEPKFMSKLNEIVLFDYMGAAEFEFGILKDSMETIIRNYPDYILSTVFRNGKIIYVICHKNQYNEVNKRIEELADGDVVLKTDPDFKRIIEKDEQENNKDTCCWFELDNNFIFTTIPLIQFKLNILLENEWESRNPIYENWLVKTVKRIRPFWPFK